MRLIQRDSLDPLHGKKKRRQANALPFGIHHLPDEIVEGIQIDAAEGDAGGMNGQQFAPEFFFGGVQAEDDDCMRFHTLHLGRLPVF